MAVRTDSAFGLVPLRTLDGSDLNGMSSGLVCTILRTGYASNLIPGDPVTFSGTGDFSGPGIVLGVAGSPIIGVFGGVLQQVVTTSPGGIIFQQAPSYVANTASAQEIIVWVYTNPKIVYAIQTDTTGIAATDIGSNANFAIVAGNLTTNQSGVVLTKGSIATTIGLNLKIIGLASQLMYPGNDFYAVGPPLTGSFNVSEVIINNHVLNSTGTTGI